mgnify:CR=1 FL=1
MAAHHGYNAKMYLGGNAQTIVNHWTMELDYDLVLNRVFGDAWDKFLIGHQRASGSFAGNFDDASGADMWDGAAVDRTYSPMYLYVDSLTTGEYYYGNVWPKLSVDVPHDGLVTFSGTWVAEDQFAKFPA